MEEVSNDTTYGRGGCTTSSRVVRNTPQAYAGTWGAVNACVPDGWPSTTPASERRGTACRPSLQ